MNRLYATITGLLLGISLCILAQPVARAEEESGTQCKTSPKVKEIISQMTRLIGDLGSQIQPSCGSGLKGDLNSLYMEFTDVSVNSSTTECSMEKHTDADGNHALSHDLKAYGLALKELDKLATRAKRSCDSASLALIRDAKNRYTNYYIYRKTESDPWYRADFAALCQAERKETVDEQLIYFYAEGYYSKNSPNRCTEKEYKMESLSEAFKNFQMTLKNMKKQADQIQPRSGAELKQEFLHRQGLMTLEQANAKVARQKNAGTSFGSLFKNLWDRIKQEASAVVEVRKKTYAEIMEELKREHTSLSQELVQTVKTQDVRTADQKKETETRRSIYKDLYNKTNAPLYKGIEELLVQTDNLIISKDKPKEKACELAKETADALKKFCERVVTNKGGICDDSSKSNTVCK